MLDDGSWKHVKKNRSNVKNNAKVSNGSVAVTSANSRTPSTNSSASQLVSNGDVINRSDASRLAPPMLDQQQQQAQEIRRQQSAHNNMNGDHRPAKSALQPSRPKTSNGVSLTLASNDPRKAIEKEIKALTKYEANAKNACWHFEEEIKKSEDRLKRAFKEMHEELSQRETVLLDELHRCRDQGLALVKARQETETQLKTQTARAATMNARDIDDLRQRIRMFMREKRLDEDLGRPLRFQYEPDKLILGIRAYGEVMPIGGKPTLASVGSPSIASLISAEGGDGSSSVDSGAGVLSEVSVGGVVIQSSSMDAQQLAELTRQMQETLRAQGISEDVLPQVSEAMPQRRRPAQPVRGAGGGQQRGVGGRGRGRPRN